MEPDQVWANLGQLLGGSDISDETSGTGRGLADKRGAGLVSRQREGLYQVKPSEVESLSVGLQDHKRLSVGAVFVHRTEGNH